MSENVLHFKKKKKKIRSINSKGSVHLFNAGEFLISNSASCSGGEKVLRCGDIVEVFWDEV